MLIYIAFQLVSLSLSLILSVKSAVAAVSESAGEDKFIVLVDSEQFDEMIKLNGYIIFHLKLE